MPAVTETELTDEEYYNHLLVMRQHMRDRYKQNTVPSSVKELYNALGEEMNRIAA